MRWKNVMFCNSTLESPSPKSNSIEFQVMNYSTNRRQGCLSWKMLYETRLQDQKISNELAWKKNKKHTKQTTTNKSYIKINSSAVGQKTLKWKQGKYCCHIALFQQDVGTWSEKKKTKLLSVYWCRIPLSTIAEGGQRLHLCFIASVHGSSLNFRVVINNVFCQMVIVALSVDTWVMLLGCSWVHN